METITIPKQELKDLIKEAVRESLGDINYSFVTDAEQAELEADFGKTPKFDRVDDVVKL